MNNHLPQAEAVPKNEADEDKWLTWALLDRISDITGDVATLIAEFLILRNELKHVRSVPDELVLAHIKDGAARYLSRIEQYSPAVAPERASA